MSELTEAVPAVRMAKERCRAAVDAAPVNLDVRGHLISALLQLDAVTEKLEIAARGDSATPSDWVDMLSEGDFGCGDP